jgi:hypothetical protein
MTRIEELMIEHQISVWQDPHCQPAKHGTKRWLAGVDLTGVELSDGCETCGYGAEIGIEARDTASGDTPSEAVLGVVRHISGKGK